MFRWFQKLTLFLVTKILIEKKSTFENEEINLMCSFPKMYFHVKVGFFIKILFQGKCVSCDITSVSTYLI